MLLFLSASHTRGIPSPQAVTKRLPARLTARARIAWPSWRSGARVVSGPGVFHRRTILSGPCVRIVLPYPSEGLGKGSGSALSNGTRVGRGLAPVREAFRHSGPQSRTAGTPGQMGTSPSGRDRVADMMREGSRPTCGGRQLFRDCAKLRFRRSWSYPLLAATAAPACATEAMFLMMKWAFEAGYRRYEWKCNALNEASCAAAERLGFSFEGIFRQAAVVKGRNRDTAWYVAIDAEWPVLCSAFLAWLDPANFDEKRQQQTHLSDFTETILKRRGGAASDESRPSLFRRTDGICAATSSGTTARHLDALLRYQTAISGVWRLLGFRERTQFIINNSFSTLSCEMGLCA